MELRFVQICTYSDYIYGLSTSGAVYRAKVTPGRNGSVWQKLDMNEWPDEDVKCKFPYTLNSAYPEPWIKSEEK